MTDEEQDAVAEQLATQLVQDWLERKTPWWERLLSSLLGFLRPKQPKETVRTFSFSEEKDTPNEEWLRRVAVADTIEKALAASKWLHHSQMDMPSTMITPTYVVGSGIRTVDENQYWIYVTIKNSLGLDRQVPLHVFLSEFIPFAPLTFEDYDA